MVRNILMQDRESEMERCPICSEGLHPIACKRICKNCGFKRDCSD